MIVDLYLVYKFIRKLTTPFEKWEAYKQGVIDQNGKIIKPKKQRKTAAERNSLPIFDRLVLNLKKLIMKVPGGKTRWATYAAALMMLREHKDLTEDRLEYLLENLEDLHNKEMFLIEANDLFMDEGNRSSSTAAARSHNPDYFKVPRGHRKNVFTRVVTNKKKAALNDRKNKKTPWQLYTYSEDAPTMAAGNGNIASIGVGSKGEPGFFNRAVKKHKKKTRIGRRILPK